MKYFVLFIIFLNTACTPNKNKAAEETNEQLQQIENFKTICYGSWAQQDYVQEVELTRSPYRSQDVLTRIDELSVDTGKINGDSLEVGALDIHEGGSFQVYLRPGFTAAAYPTNITDEENSSNFYELGYVIKNSDTSLIIYHYDKNKTLLDKTAYMRVPANSEDALQYMVNKKLFAGSYKATDSTGNISTVHFTNDGIVNGFPGFQKYYVITDFVAAPENSGDKVCFDVATKNQKCYGYTISNDTIRLYEYIEEEESVSFRPGPAVYDLVKVK